MGQTENGSDTFPNPSSKYQFDLISVSVFTTNKSKLIKWFVHYGCCLSAKGRKMKQRRDLLIKGQNSLKPYWFSLLEELMFITTDYKKHVAFVKPAKIQNTWTFIIDIIFNQIQTSKRP